MQDQDTTVAELKEKVIAFRDERDWAQFHNPKDLAIAMSIEVAEVMELCRFKPAEIVLRESGGDNQGAFAQELADVFSYLLTLAHTMNIDLSSALEAKMKINAEHYPVALAKGKPGKYTDYIDRK